MGGYGVEVWKVSGPQGEWMLKVGLGPGAQKVAREAVVWSRIAGMVPAASHGSGCRYGLGAAAAWLATRWLNGPSLWELFAPVRQHMAKTYEGAVTAAVETCLAVAAVHEKGWVHGSLQPWHITMTPDGVRLIDWAWAWSPTGDLPPADAYTGALVHLSSPEMLAREELPMRITPADEVWSLAATLWWAASGRWPRDYRAMGIDPDTFTAAELANVVVRHRAPLGRLGHWPELETALRTVLTAPEEKRPTAMSLARHLGVLSL